ncbi:MAG: twin-arginine translocase subunit TatC [Verrucomicrobia bacterium]|nr:twin-arginine translocase subunit TatC [Verrucomicrobiota bacterium]
MPPSGTGPSGSGEEPPAEEEEGGPVKTFLEHLEDFRWLIIKCATAIMLTMVVLVFASNYLIAIMKWPLKRAAAISTDDRQYVSVRLGSKELFSLRTTNRHELPGLLLPTNKFVEVEMFPFSVGSGATNYALGLRVRSASNELPPGEEMRIIFPSPAAPFITSLKLAFFGGLLLAAPFVFYFIAQFLLPALKKKEKLFFKKALYPAIALFLIGVSLCYFVILPVALKAAEAYSHWMGVDMLFWHADEYFSFTTKFMLGMGLGFEMPVILLALVRIGVLDYAKLASWRRYMILINLVLGALLTTPEVLTQVLMFVPLQALYELTIWIAWYWEQADRASARRRLTMGVLAFVFVCVALWFGYQYGWPWLKSLLH